MKSSRHPILQSLIAMLSSQQITVTSALTSMAQPAWPDARTATSFIVVHALLNNTNIRKEQPRLCLQRLGNVRSALTNVPALSKTSLLIIVGAVRTWRASLG